MKRLISIFSLTVGICSASYGFGTTNYTSSLPFLSTDWSRIHNLPLFDTNGLGALIQVDIQWILTSTNSFQYENLSTNTGTSVRTLVQGTNLLSLPGSLGT